MRAALFYNPRLLLERLVQKWREHSRLRRLRGTCAADLVQGHVDSLELIEMAAAEGARVFYDIGANVGTWTLLCRALVPQSVIVAFEPMEAHIIAFEKNTSNLENVRLVPVALGSMQEVRTFHPASFSDASSFLPLNEAGRQTWHIENVSPQKMSVIPLDHLVVGGALPLPDMLKLDVQGFELEVLKGSEETLRGARWVLSEVSFREFYDGQVLFSQLAAFLFRHGFEVHAFGWSLSRAIPLQQVDVLFQRR